MANIDIDQPTHASDAELTTLHVMILSGIGGAAISLGSFPDLLKGNVEFFATAGSVELFGFAIRIIGGTFLGAFWGYLHCPESKPIKAFQLGLIAPAAIASLVFTNMDAAADRAGRTQTSAIEQSIVLGAHQVDAQPGLFSLVGSARAGVLADTIVTQPRSPSEGFLDRLIKGITGK